jgi:cytochrome b pre-mRNA-processing protein 3
MSFITRIFGDRQERARMQPLYDRIVAEARDPWWYRDGGVPDTIDGRFDMVSSVLALVLLRIEGEGEGEGEGEREAARRAEMLLTEVFIDDMDGTVRQIGIGDQVVGKHVGRMMGALGGRLGAYRDAAEDDEAFNGAVRRNIFRDAPPSDEAVAAVAGRLARLRGALAGVSLGDLLSGKLPSP